ncbi:MAG TPA: hypothetical protein VNY31_04035 [Solirubrobacteraceae bacterium]|nr:hypothetical protein [Solirubrobacteraceae bacterium]
MRQLGQQLADRPLAGRIRLERPRHERPAQRIDFDSAAFASVDNAPHIQIADHGPARRAAAFRLLDGALQYLRRQVAAVELADRRHDAVQQQPGWRLVDVLGHGHQLGPRSPDRQVDRHVIGSAARQAVNLVHDDVLDRVLCEVSEHPL